MLEILHQNFQEVVSHLTWISRTKLGCSGSNALSHWTISPASKFSIFIPFVFVIVVQLSFFQASLSDYQGTICSTSQSYLTVFV